MLPYYAHAFKTGSYPPVRHDRIFLWSRPHPARASAPDDEAIGRPAHWERVSDHLWAIAFAASPAQVVLRAGVNRQAFSVRSGVSKLKLASAPGGISAQMFRDGRQVVEVDPGDAFAYTENPAVYNFNAFVACS
jgi:glucan endo-1,3-alpha-glucosidase